MADYSIGGRMAGAIAHLRDCPSMDRPRAIVGAGIFGMFGLLGLILVLITSDGVKDWKGRPLGADFIVFYTGGETARTEGAAAAYDVNRIFAAHQKILDEEAPNWGPFLYPPAFLFAAMSLATLPYAAAWIIWMIATGALYLFATRAIAGFRFSFIPILGFSAVYLNMMQGQTGFLIAGLFAAGLWSLFAGRQIAAGLFLGLVAVKPQYGVLVPVALAAGGYWRAFAAAAFAAAITIAAPFLAFGGDVWRAFADSSRIARVEVLENGGIGYFKIISAFSQVRMAGGSIALAYVAQAAVSLSALAAVFAVWRSDRSDHIKGAALILATLLAMPYVVEYDLVLLAPFAAFLIAEARGAGFRGYEKSLLIALFLTPALTRQFTAATSVSLGLLLLLALSFALFRRFGAPKTVELAAEGAQTA